jgi:cobalt-zinc-cadmium efflux system protein
MAHHHGHDHGGAAHAKPGAGKAFAIGIAMNLGFVAVEVVYGLLSRSMALVADAGHNLSDVLGLALSLGAALLARRPPSPTRTYGLRGTTILASLANALVLLFVIGGVAWESARRLFASPQAVEGKTVIAVALAGVVVNGASAALFLGGRHGDLNVRSAFLHLASDAALSFGVALSGLLLVLTGAWWIDPVVSIALSIVILVSTWSLLKASLHLALQGAPAHVDVAAVRSYLERLPNVSEVHDFHVWSMSTTEVALTAHVVMPLDACTPALLRDISEQLHDRFGIEHSTLQVDPPAPHECVLSTHAV